MDAATPSRSGDDEVTRLEPRPFRGGRDGAIAAAFVVAVAGCTVAAIVWGHAAAVLGAVYSAMAFLVWLEAFRSTWAVGPSALSARRWAVWRTFRAEDVTAVGLDPGEPGIDLSIAGGGLSRVVVPLDDWRRRPGALDRLDEFLTNAQDHGARVDAPVWDALRRRR